MSRIFIGFHGDSMGFNGIFMGLKRDLLWGLIGNLFAFGCYSWRNYN